MKNLITVLAIGLSLLAYQPEGLQKKRSEDATLSVGLENFDRVDDNIFSKKKLPIGDGTPVDDDNNKTLGTIGNIKRNDTTLPE